MSLVERHHEAADALDQQRARGRRDRVPGRTRPGRRQSIVRLSAPAAMSGDSGAAKRQGEMSAIVAGVDRPTERREQQRRCRCLRCAGSKPLTTGLSASTARPCARRWRIRPQATKVLPMSVPVAVTNRALMIAPASTRVAHDVGEALDLGVGMAGGEGEAQPRGALRHGRRADGDDQEAFRCEQAAGGERRLGRRRGRSARSGSAPPAGRARRVKAVALASGQAAKSGSRSMMSSAAIAAATDRRRQAGRIDQGAGAVVHQVDHRPRGAQIAAIAADRLRQRAHLQRHVGGRAGGEGRAAAAADARRCRGRRRTAARRRSAARARRARRAERGRRPWKTRRRSRSARVDAGRGAGAAASRRGRRRCAGRSDVSRAELARPPTGRHATARRAGPDRRAPISAGMMPALAR